MIFVAPKTRTSNYRLLLVFAGSYLFAITVIHILPELYKQFEDVELIGLFVLLGFFIQQFLEYFTSGIEHGHIHSSDHQVHNHSHTHSEVSALVLLAALCLHAFLEGGMVARGEGINFQYDINAILLGIALHRAPAAFALMAVLSDQFHSKKRAIPYLIVFSVAAPLGLFVSEYLIEIEILSQAGLIFLFAVVSGNFLHISTTIVFESSPDHHFNARKLAVAIVGSLVAVAVEYML